MDGVEITQWDFDPALLEYVKTYHMGQGRVERIVDENPLRVAFEQKAKDEFTNRGIAFDYVKTYLSVQKPVKGAGYDLGYPHQHVPLTGTTLIHYLDPGDVPAPLHILDAFDGNVLMEFIPEPGKTVFIRHDIWHGVLKNQGTKPRIQIIASAIT